MGRARELIVINIYRIILLVLLILLWEYSSDRYVSSLIIGKPSLIAQKLYSYVFSRLFLEDLSFTLQATFSGLILGILGGVAFGIAFSYFKLFARVVEPFIIAINSLPRPAIAPLFVTWLGFGVLSKTMVAFSIVFFIAFFNTINGIASINPELIKVVRVMGASRIQIMRYIVIPSILSWVFAAFKTSVGFALIGAIIGEFVGSTRGLGYRMLILSGYFDTSGVFALLILLMILGYAIVKISEKIENIVLKWRPQAQILSIL
ncbi:MAG: ABC transporter permease [Desulfurococcales archaeon]|jgi:NitT/TauT family transport system permease protein|nr:ABC transporter permease [Desulfurococcales archaeon]